MIKVLIKFIFINLIFINMQSMHTDYQTISTNFIQPKSLTELCIKCIIANDINPIYLPHQELKELIYKLKKEIILNRIKACKAYLANLSNNYWNNWYKSIHNFRDVMISTSTITVIPIITLDLTTEILHRYRAIPNGIKGDLTYAALIYITPIYFYYGIPIVNKLISNYIH